MDRRLYELLTNGLWAVALVAAVMIVCVGAVRCEAKKTDCSEEAEAHMHWERRCMRSQECWPQ